MEELSFKPRTIWHALSYLQASIALQTIQASFDIELWSPEELRSAYWYSVQVAQQASLHLGKLSDVSEDESGILAERQARLAACEDLSCASMRVSSDCSSCSCSLLADFVKHSSYVPASYVAAVYYEAGRAEENPIRETV